MLSKNISVASEAKEHDRSFHAAFLAVKQARHLHVKVRPHRAITALKVTPYLLAQALLLPLILCAMLYWGKPVLLDFWRDVIVFWSSGLGLSFGQTIALNDVGQVIPRLSTGSVTTPLPTLLALSVTTLITLAGLLLSLTMKGATLPLKYPLRIVCIVQLVATVYFWWLPGSFPYNMARHSEELLTVGYVVTMGTPVMLAMGYYILNQSLVLKLFHTFLILGFLAIMVPHQVLVQAFIMQHFSVLFMPVLYICFGAVFDALVFVALYSWAVSSVPADATV